MSAYKNFTLRETPLSSSVYLKIMSASRRSHVLPVGSKRTAPTRDLSVSPPPKKTKTKLASNASRSALEAFFTPVSQKSAEKLVWRTVNSSLLVARFTPDCPGLEAQGGKHNGNLKRRKIAAFDFDSTLISTSSGNVFSKSPSDWKWWNPVVPSKLRKLHEEGYQLVVITNQGGISTSSKGNSLSTPKRLGDFKTKCGAFLHALNVPISIYAATEHDVYRKPRIGIWTEVLNDLGLEAEQGQDTTCVDLQNSLFVGDAAGRVARGSIKADHSSSDRDFAENICIAFFTPEQFFLKDNMPVEWGRSFDPLKYIYEATQATTTISNTDVKAFDKATDKLVFTKNNGLEIIVLVGSPGAGKSTFYFSTLEHLGYARANQDLLKSRDKCLRFARASIEKDISVAVDNTNADRKTRAEWINLAKELNVSVRCVWLQAPLEVCKHNEAIRYLNAGTRWNPEDRKVLPSIAFGSYGSRFEKPTKSEGFEELIEIPFRFDGTDEMRKLWTRYWV